MITLRDGFVINPDNFWKPAYRISPYSTYYVQVNKRIIDRGIVDYTAVIDFFGGNFFPTLNGRSAIALALQQYNLDPHDEVLIITTSGNRYISSCVTNEVEKICKWSMKMSDQTKLIFVNHEFGYCYQELEGLSKYNLPIIEDMALSFASVDKNGKAGRMGDFVIYSLPKFFPLSFGGVLKCNNLSKLKYPPKTDAQLEKYFFTLMTNYLLEVQTIKKSRLDNFDYLQRKFRNLDFEPFFEATTSDIPGVFLFKVKDIDTNDFKKFMLNNGIESSVFYGENAFFVPVHQGLRQEDMDFFYSLALYFMENGNK
jgi:perosamine synthetase